MEEKLNKLLGLIETLPVDQIVIIAEKCKGLGEVSPKVRKMISVFEKLSDEEKEQFFRNVKPNTDGSETMEGDDKSMDTEHSAADKDGSMKGDDAMADSGSDSGESKDPK